MGLHTSNVFVSRGTPAKVKKKTHYVPGNDDAAHRARASVLPRDLLPVYAGLDMIHFN